MLNHVIYNREEIDLTHALLAALLSTVGVKFILGHDTNRDELRALVTSLIRAMPGQLQELVAGVDESMASISMTMYR
jgi:hypothetical protein